MTNSSLGGILERLASGELSVKQALELLGGSAVEDLGYANVDHLRPALQGTAEIVFCQGKTTDQVLGICKSLADARGTFLATRVPDVMARAILDAFPAANHNATAATVHTGGEELAGRGEILIITAGTSDLSVAEEAAVVATYLGNSVLRLNDVGVAGIHRLLGSRDMLRSPSVIIVVAGMDGALASVVGGMVSVPVIAVPTSVGYGTAFGGLAPLLAMLNSCASGVTVVNIDNGFGAAVAASRINRAT